MPINMKFVPKINLWAISLRTDMILLSKLVVMVLDTNKKRIENNSIISLL